MSSTADRGAAVDPGVLDTVYQAEDSSREERRKRAYDENSDKCRLFKLPAELRNEIYKLAFFPEDELEIHATRSIAGAVIPAPRRFQTPGITRVCQQIRLESLALFYALSSFHIDIAGSTEELRKWLVLLPQKAPNGKVVKHLTIQLGDKRQFGREHLKEAYDYWKLVELSSDLFEVLSVKGFAPANITITSPSNRLPEPPRQYLDLRCPTGCPPSDILRCLLEVAIAQRDLPHGYTAFVRLPPHDRYLPPSRSRHPVPRIITNMWISVEGSLAVFPENLGSDVVASPEDLVKVLAMDLESANSLLSKVMILKKSLSKIDGVKSATREKLNLLIKSGTSDFTSITPWRWGWSVVPRKELRQIHDMLRGGEISAQEARQRVAALEVI